MKNILIPFLILLSLFATGQYTPSGAYNTTLSKPIGLTAKADGSRTYKWDAANFVWRPYVSVAEANAWLTGGARQGHFYVVINTGGTLVNGIITGGTNALYIYKDGIADVDLVPMGVGLASLGIGLSGTLTDPRADTSYIDKRYQKMFNVRNYGGYGDSLHDETDAIIRTIFACYSAGGGTVLIPAGVWRLDAAPTTSYIGTTPNAVIYFPVDSNAVPPYPQRSVVIRIIGESQANFIEGALNDVNVTRSGTIIQSNYNNTSGALRYVFGTYANNIAGDHYNYIDLKMENLTVRTKTGKNMSGINGEWFANNQFDNVRVDIDTPLTKSIAPSNTIGIKSVITNGGTLVDFRNTFVEGYKHGYVMGEHGTGNNVQAMGCLNGFSFTSMNHSANFGRLGAYWCANPINIYGPESVGSVFVNIAQLNVEARQDGHWYDNVTTIKDSLDHIYGTINYYALFTTTAALNISGAANWSKKRVAEGWLPAKLKMGESGDVTTATGLNPSGATIMELKGANIAGATTKYPQVLFNVDQSNSLVSDFGIVGRTTFYNRASTLADKRLWDEYLTMNGTVNNAHKLIYATNPAGTFSNIFEHSADTFLIKTGKLGVTSKAGTGVKVAGFDANGFLIRTSIDTGGSGGTGTPGGSNTQIQYNSSGTFAGSANLIWDNTNARFGIGGAPSAPLHIIAPSVSGYGQFSIQAVTGTAGSSLAYMSWRDGAGGRMMVEGFGQYAGSPDLNFYYANEINGSYIWRNSSAQIAELTTDGKFGLGITPTQKLHVYDGSSTVKALIESGNTSTLAGIDFKVGGTNFGSLRAIGSSAGAAPYNNSSLSLYGTGVGGTSIANSNAGGYVSIITNNGVSEGERMHVAPDGSVKWNTYVSGNEVSSDTTNKKILVADAIGNMQRSYWPSYAPLVSPAFTSVPTAPTATNYTNTTQLSNTAFTQQELMYRKYAASGDADYTVATQVYFVELTNPITANRVLTLPSVGSSAGRELKVYNRNVGSNTWSFAGTVTTPTGIAVTTMANGTWYILYCDGSNWILQNSGIVAYTSKTTTYSITSADYTVDCSGTFTVTLPTAASATGKEYLIKNSGTGTITVATTSSQTIDGVTTKTLNVQYGGLKVQSNGSNYIVVGSF